MRTKEEKRIAANISAKRWRDNNKEQVAAVKKAWRTNNPDKVKARNKKWNDENRAHLLAYKKAHHEAKKLPYYIVYGLPNHFYCGITNQPEPRMSAHRSEHKRTTHNYFIMATAETRDEALEIEAEFHDAGWDGRSAIHN